MNINNSLVLIKPTLVLSASVHIYLQLFLEYFRGWIWSLAILGIHHCYDSSTCVTGVIINFLLRLSVKVLVFFFS